MARRLLAEVRVPIHCFDVFLTASSQIKTIKSYVEVL